MDSRTTWPALIGALIRGETLTADETAWAMNEIMDGAATPAQIAGLRRRAADEGRDGRRGHRAGPGHARRTRRRSRSPAGSSTWSAPAATGRRTVNISTMGTIAAAAAGARMVKHGNRAASSACGTADVLEALGVVIDLPAAGDRAAGRARSASRSCSRRCITRRCGTSSCRGASSACRRSSTSSARWRTRPGPALRRSAWPTRGWGRSWPACWPGAAARPWCSTVTTAWTS